MKKRPRFSCWMTQSLRDHQGMAGRDHQAGVAENLGEKWVRDVDE